MQIPNIKETNLDFSSLSPRKATDMIVLHHVGGNNVDVSAEQIHQWHKNQGWAGIGYHYVVRKDGTIERGRPHWTIGAHAYGFNSNSIGINVAGDFSLEAPTKAQIEAVSMLVGYVAKTYGLPIDSSHVLGHRDLMATSCPGQVFYNMLQDVRGKANWYQQN